MYQPDRGGQHVFRRWIGFLKICQWRKKRQRCPPTSATSPARRHPAGVPEAAGAGPSLPRLARSARVQARSEPPRGHRGAGEHRTAEAAGASARSVPGRIFVIITPEDTRGQCPGLAASRSVPARGGGGATGEKAGGPTVAATAPGCLRARQSRREREGCQPWPPRALPARSSGRCRAVVSSVFGD